jgi:hypothetical protein
VSDAGPAQRAAHFVAARGGALARARAAALGGSGSPKDALAVLGSAPPDASPSAQLLCLRVCDELGQHSDPLARSAGERLAAAQQPDGGFCAEAAPGEDPLDARLTFTGMAAGYLTRMPFARPELLEAAGDFLARHFSPERVQGFRLASVGAYAHFFANALHESADEILQWCGRELERGFRARAFDAVVTVHVFACCDAHALPGARLSREELALALRAEQSADGGFGLPVASDAERVEATLTALVGLRHLRIGS